MSYVNPDSLISTQGLADYLVTPDVLVVDAGWFLPGEELDGREEYENAHIPGAVFFDIDAYADTESDLPHMLP
ncbi:MAG: sulfurtransferase, partial [Alphaproteobacteria bacterium]|nr:sulfurtransferase [Alphaproteobacteria bacterium]